MSKLLILTGILCYLAGTYLIIERNSPSRLSFKDYKIDYRKIPANNPPVRIIIRELNIDLPVIPAKIQNNNWETTTNGASYLISSALPGETGNSIIYAHDWASLFGPLNQAERGMTVDIEYKDKTNKSFVIIGSALVSDRESSILDKTPDKRLTLFTCAGFLDSKRLVTVAIYKDDNSLLTTRAEPSNN
jgi:LPXTG-site transpeptidase (sortase) family protein